MSRNYVGPVPYQEFLDTYMKPSRKYSPVTTVGSKILDLLGAISQNPSTEEEMSWPLLDFINATCKQFKFTVATKECSDGGTVPNMEIKRSCGSDAFSVQFLHQENLTSLLTKSNKQNDDYQDSSTPRTTSYAASQFTRQHRVFLFTICIFNSYARIVRWDRLGAVVSEPIHHHDDPCCFVDLFKRFSQMTDKQLGLDTSVTLANRVEEGLLLNAIREHLKESVKRNESLSIPDVEETFDESFPSYKIQVQVENQPLHSYIVKKPFQSSSSLWGRSTRAYIAYGLSEKRLVFLKDYWRPIRIGRDSEGEIYDEFDESFKDDPDVRQHLPTVIYGGDVRYKSGSSQKLGDVQETETENRLDSSRMCLRHHRIIQEIAFSLLDVTSSRDVVQIICDVVKIIIAIFKSKSKRLHRDISILNIMTVEIKGKLRGILNDWDHSKKMLPSTDSNINRTGTWHFMSILVACQKAKVHSMLDDLESCFWVLLYVALHCFKNNAKRSGLEMFQEMNDEQQGGGKKSTYLRRPPLGHPLRVIDGFTFDCVPLHQLIEDLRLYFKDFHDAINGSDIVAFKTLEKDRLKHPEVFLAMFDNALAADGWADSDAVVGDNFPPLNINRRTKQTAETAAEDRVKTFDTRDAEQDSELEDDEEEEEQSTPSSPALVENGEDVE
ncbi:hypothetical protein ABKN59_011405 [Abortiporus biennis]